MSLSTCTNALHYFPHPSPAITGFKRLLAEQGQLVLEDFARRESPFPWRAFEWLLRRVDPDHVQAYSLGSAQALCTHAALQVHEAEAFRINWLWQEWALRAHAEPEKQ